MKEYEPKKMVQISRYQNFFPTLSAEIQDEIYARMSELIEEENEYCDKGNYSHMAQILTSIAMYEVLQKHGKSEEEAYRIVSEEMWKFLDPSGMQKMAKLSFFLPLMKKIVPFGFKKGSGTGWRYTWHQDDPKNEFHFECNECIYAKILGKHCAFRRWKSREFYLPNSPQIIPTDYRLPATDFPPLDQVLSICCRIRIMSADASG